MKAIEAAQLKCWQTNQNLLLAFQLQKFLAKNGSYPESLEALEKSPGITVLPDLCNGQPLNDTRTDDGYVLYSVGTSGVDESGRSWNDPPAEGEISKADDIIVRMPLPLPKPEERHPARPPVSLRRPFTEKLARFASLRHNQYTRIVIRRTLVPSIQ